jgi:hypothetical protein
MRRAASTWARELRDRVGSVERQGTPLQAQAAATLGLPRRCGDPPPATYVLDTFPVVRKRDEAQHGEYRTARVILDVYDRMGDAARTGVPYATLLDPPPADPRIAHPPRDAGRADLTGTAAPVPPVVERRHD